MSLLSLFYYCYLMFYGAGAGFELFWILLSGLSLFAKLLMKHNVLNRYIPKGIKIVLFGIFFIIITLFLAVEFFIIKDSIKHKSYDQTDYLIILGASVKGKRPSLSLRFRLEAAVDFLEENSQTRVIVSGGQGPGELITEAEAMKRYLLEQGIEEDRIIKEDQSTSTVENLKYSFSIIDKTSSNASISIVSSDFHIFRVKMLAGSFGKTVQGIPAKAFRPSLIHYYVREFFAVAKDYIFHVL